MIARTKDDCSGSRQPGGSPEKSRSGTILRQIALYSMLAILAALGLSAHIAQRLTCTGDEPRYLLYALSLNLEGKPVMSDDGYEWFRKRRGLHSHVAAYPLKDIQGVSKIPAHSILPSVILAPFVTWLSLQRVRLVALLAGLIGLWFLAKLFIAQKLPLVTALACFVPPALFLPALPFYFLALPEVFLFLLVCIAFWNICSPADTLRGFWPSILSSCLAPFIHLRGIPIFITVALCLAFKLGWRPRAKISWPTLLRIVCIYSGSALLVVLYNRTIYGNVFGSVTTARPSLSLSSIAALLLNWHHGILTYAPIYFLSFAGLLAGVWRRQVWGLVSGIFLILLISASAGPDPGESYPARFWVQGTPVLAICLIGFLQGGMPRLLKAVTYGLLGSVSLANTILFLIQPALYLAARSGASPYDRLFEIAPWIHLGFWVNLVGQDSVQLMAVCYCCTLISILALASIRRSKLIASLAILLLLAGLEAHRARLLRCSPNLEKRSVAIAILDSDITTGAPIRLTLRASWRVNLSVRTLQISDGSTQWEEDSRAAILLRRTDPWPTPLFLRIDWIAPDLETFDAREIQVLISESWLAKIL
jgi:hypothetical protein